MLKLIYSLSEKQITLKFDKRNNFWTRELLLALGISLLAHFLFYLAIHIKSTQPRSELILKPSGVFAEIKITPTALRPASIDGFGFLQSQLTRPQKTVFFEQTEIFNNKTPLALLEEPIFSPHYQLNVTSVKSLESQVLMPPLEAFKIAEAVRVIASPNLASRLSIPKFKAKKIAIEDTETLFCQFNVEFEDRTGKLFLSELVTSSGYLKYDRYALKILEGLKLKAEKGRFSTKGEIQVFMEASKRDLYD